MSYSKIIMSVGMIVFVAAVVVGGTGAFFSDTETSTGNVFAAGDIDLQIDNESYAFDYNIPGYDNPQGEFVLNPNTSWELTDLTVERFFDFYDLKPGDYGEDTISIHVGSNDAWVCAAARITADDDNDITEPEDEEAGSNSDNDDGTPDGDLDEALNFAFWVDDGDNVLETDEVDNIFVEGSLDGLGQLGPIALADANGGPFGNLPIPGGETVYVAKAWCFGELTADGTTAVTPGDNSPLVDTGVSCNGSNESNIAQTDSVEGDLEFYAVQARNNGQFSCENDWNPGFDSQLPTVGAQELAGFSAPASCDVTVDDDFGVDTPGSEYTTIQGAIDDTSNVADGSVVCVADGEYDEFVVNRPLTIAGLTNPALGSAKVTPSAPTVTELAFITSSNVTVTGLHFDGEGTAFTGSQTAGVQISSTGGDIDNVNVTYNVIENLLATGATAANKGIQWFSDADDGDVLTNSTFAHNIISDIKADNKGAYGIQTVGATENLTMNYNTIEDIDGAWGAGIAMDTKDTLLTPVTNTSIMRNHIMDALGANEVAIQVEFKVTASEVSANFNNVTSMLQGGGNTDLNTEGTIDAENNWWGDLDPSDNVFGDVDYTPFATGMYPTV